MELKKYTHVDLEARHESPTSDAAVARFSEYGAVMKIPCGDHMNKTAVLKANLDP
jgi:hypothetical protein